MPPRELSPNGKGHCHWAVKKREKDKWQDDIGWLIHAKCGQELYRLSTLPRFHGEKISPLIPRDRRAVLHLDWYMAGRGDGLYRPMDEGNAISAFKHGLDQLVRCGLLEDDKTQYVTTGRVNLYRQKKDHKGRCELVVTLEWEE